MDADGSSDSDAGGDANSWVSVTVTDPGGREYVMRSYEVALGRGPSFIFIPGAPKLVADALKPVNRLWRRFQPPVVHTNHAAVGVFELGEPDDELHEIQVTDRQDALTTAERIATQIRAGKTHF